MEFLFVFLMLFYLVVIPLSIAIYVFNGLALYKAAKLEGYSKKWFAWIPVVNTYLLFKLGNKNPNYMWLSIINMPIIFALNLLLNNNYDFNLTLSTLLLIIMLVISIFMIVITIQAYLNIANRYDISAVWFILGIFISPFSLVAYIIWFNKLRKIEKEKFDLE